MSLPSKGWPGRPLPSARDRPIGETVDPQFCTTRGVPPAFQVNQMHDAHPLQGHARKDVSGRHRMISANFRVHSLDPSSDTANFLPRMA